MDEYRLTLKVRNNLLMSAIERAGYKSQIEFAKREGISAPLLYKLVNMKQSPVRSDGTIRKGVVKICEALNCLPEDIFSDDQMYSEVSQNTFETTCDKDELVGLTDPRGTTDSLDSDIANQMLSEYISKALGNLTDREAGIIKKRFGLCGEGEMGLEDLAKMYGVSRERIRQIEAKGIRRLRHPSNFWCLDGYIPEEKQEALEAYMSARQ